MLQATNNANAAASVHPNNAEHSLAQGADPSHQALLGGLTAWRTQGNLHGLVAQHRDTASRLIEQFLNEPHSLTLDLRGLQLKGLPAKFANLQPILHNRGSAATPAVFRIDHEAFASAAQCNAYVKHFGPYLQVAQPKPSGYTAPTSTGRPSGPCVPPHNPNAYRQSARCVAAVVGAMQKEALPLLGEAVKSLKNLAQREDSTLQAARNFFISMRGKVNSNIAKTSAKPLAVGTLPDLDCRYPLLGQEKMRRVQEDLNHVGQVLQNAKTPVFRFASNVSKAVSRVQQLQRLACFVDKMFDCLHTLQREAPRLQQELCSLEKSLGSLHALCLKAEGIGPSAELNSVPLTDQLTHQIEALDQANKDLDGLRCQLGGLVQVELPDELTSSLPLLQQILVWSQQYQPQFEALQQHIEISQQLAQLACVNLDLMTTKDLCAELAWQLCKLPASSRYWPLIERHPVRTVSELISCKPQTAPVEETLEAVHVRHTDVGLVTQKDEAFEAAAMGDLKALHQCLMTGLNPEVRNEQQQTLLHVAAANDCVALIKWLANVQKLPLEATCKDGCTPFLTAAENGHTVAMAALHDAGANPTAQDKRGDKVIHLAVLSENISTLEYCEKIFGQKCLEELGHEGRTPLLAAARDGKNAAMVWLIQRGADTSARDRHGFQAIQLAVRSGSIATLKYCKDVLGQSLQKPGFYGRPPLLSVAEHGKSEAMQWLINGDTYKAANKNGSGLTGTAATHHK